MDINEKAKRRKGRKEKQKNVQMNNKEEKKRHTQKPSHA